ncbi:NlpC/P60 family protein [Maribacter sp. CXY002]|uniref:C40 family peptidase n=1 Tax=Maribacter luteocoastalis TaxID=3407671 RepID=UPI003B683CE7
MQYGICPLSIVPVRDSPDESAAMISQLLFGEHFKILETRKYWSKIRAAYDSYEGWILNTQLVFITEETYDDILNAPNTYSFDLITFVEKENSLLLPILLGSTVCHSDLLSFHFDGNIIEEAQEKINLINTALLYLNTPQLFGGRTPFGIDASGLTQMVYKINGYKLLRTAEEQASQGTALSFVEESEPGDLAFFDNASGIIDHVGIIMENNYVIHVNGMVRIDRIDHTGIFNNDVRNYTHKLRVIKKII